MAKRLLRIATRKSPLALWQANFIGRQLQQIWPNISVELLPLITSGDQFLKDKLQTMGGKGLFVKELEEALLEKRADLAVHSLKDVPSKFPEDLCLAAICKRDNPLDCFISPTYASLEELTRVGIIGTSSLRRAAQLKAYRSDLTIKSLRGNIHTRLEKLNHGEFDAIILAAAGLERMDMKTHIRQTLDEDLMLPACGQGALGIECRSNDQELLKLLEPLNHHITAICVSAERQVNARLGGNCHVPVAIYCKETADNQILLRARVFSADGQTVVKDEREGTLNDALHLADVCADYLLNNGAAKLLSDIL